MGHHNMDAYDHHLRLVNTQQPGGISFDSEEAACAKA
jgi:hypothetical protein